jgi:hypothetical protein
MRPRSTTSTRLYGGTYQTTTCTVTTVINWMKSQTVIRVRYSAFGKSLCTYKRRWKWCSRTSIKVSTRLISFANTFCKSAFGKSLCTYKRCWKWCPRASIQTSTRLILFTNTFCRSAFGKSLCTYKGCRKFPSVDTNPTTNPKSTYRSLSAQRLSERTV